MNRNHQLVEEGDNLEPRYAKLVGGVAASTFVIFAAKVGATVLVSSLESTAVALRYWRGVFPYLAILDRPEVFQTVVTHSTIIVAVVAAVWQIPALLRPRGRLHAWGRAAAVLAAAETYVMELVRHFYFHEVMRVDRIWYAVFPLLAGAVLAMTSIAGTSPLETDDATTSSDDGGDDAVGQERELESVGIGRHA